MVKGHIDNVSRSALWATGLLSFYSQFPSDRIVHTIS